MPFRKPHQTSDPDYIERFPKDSSTIDKYVIKPKGLNIIWGNDLRYWKSTTETYAELLQVSWLEVSGKVPLEKGKSYTVKFIVEVNKNGFGWEHTKVLVMAKVGKTGQYDFRPVILTSGQELTIPEDSNQLIINVKADERDPELYFGLYEVWSGKWKGGLLIKKAEVVKVNPTN